MRKQVVAVIRHAKSYADKVKEVKEHAKLQAQCITCNTVLSFTDDDLLLGLKSTIVRCLSLAIFEGKKSNASW